MILSKVTVKELKKENEQNIEKFFKYTQNINLIENYSKIITNLIKENIEQKEELIKKYEPQIKPKIDKHYKLKIELDDYNTVNKFRNQVIADTNKDKYIDQYKNNKKEERKVYEFDKGDNYESEFKSDNKEGQGIFCYNDRNKYEDDLKNDKTQNIKRNLLKEKCKISSFDSFHNFYRTSNFNNFKRYDEANSNDSFRKSFNKCNNKFMSADKKKYH